MQTADALDIVCPTSLTSSGVEVLAIRVASLFPDYRIQVRGVGRALIDETSGPRIIRANLDEIIDGLEQQTPTRSLIVMGLPESGDASRRLVTQIERHGVRAALLLERPGIPPLDVGSDIGLKGVKNLITLNANYYRPLVQRYHDAKIWKAGLALPNEFFTMDSTPRDDLLVFTGRATESKGFGDLLDWWSRSRLRERGVRLRTNLIGPICDEFAGAADRLGVERDTLAGVDERGQIAGIALACLFPAHNDHLPQALLECMASRGLVICTDIPGHSAVVQHGRNGLLTPMGLGDLDRQLLSVRQDLSQCLTLRNSARETAREGHGVESSKVMWARILDSILQ